MFAFNLDDDFTNRLTALSQKQLNHACSKADAFEKFPIPVVSETGLNI